MSSLISYLTNKSVKSALPYLIVVAFTAVFGVPFVMGSLTVVLFGIYYWLAISYDGYKFELCGDLTQEIWITRYIIIIGAASLILSSKYFTELLDSAEKKKLKQFRKFRLCALLLFLYQIRLGLVSYDFKYDADMEMIRLDSFTWKCCDNENNVFLIDSTPFAADSCCSDAQVSMKCRPDDFNSTRVHRFKSPDSETSVSETEGNDFSRTCSPTIRGERRLFINSMANVCSIMGILQLSCIVFDYIICDVLVTTLKL